jgi:hypothetical protein
MKDEYDFSNGERGKFHRPDATLKLPVYLDADVLEFLQERARAKGVALSRLVNDVLKQNIALIEAVK